MSAGDCVLEVSGMAARRGHRSMSMAALPTISGVVETAAAEAAAAAAAAAAEAEAEVTEAEAAAKEAATAKAEAARSNVESVTNDDGDTGGGAGGGGEIDSIGFAPAVPPLRLSGVMPAVPRPGAFLLGPTTINDDDHEMGKGGIIVAEAVLPEHAPSHPLPNPRIATPRHGDLLDGEPDSEPPSAYQSPTMSPGIVKVAIRGYGVTPGSPAAAVSIPAAAAEKMMVLWERRAAAAAAAAEGDGEGTDSCGSSRSSLLNMVRSLQSRNRRGLAAAGLHSIQNRWRRVSNAVAGIVRAHKLVAADHSEFVNDNKSALMQAQAGKLDVALEVKDVRDLDKINYARQGNRDMYSGDMINRRRAIRTHPQVMEAIRAWWRWLPKSATRVVVVVGGGGDEEDEVFAATLDEPIYSAMVVAVTMVLLPRFGLPVDEHYDPKEDWLDDNKGLPYMDFPNFFDALFELADMWSEGVGGPEYAELLTFLLHGVQDMEKRHGKFGRLLKRFGHKPAPQATPPASSGGASAGRAPQKSQARGKIATGTTAAPAATRSPRVSTGNGNGHGNSVSDNNGTNGNGAAHDNGGGAGSHSNANGRRRSDRPSDARQVSPPSSPGAMGAAPAGRGVRTSDASRGKVDPRVGPASPHTPSLSTPPQPRQQQSALSMRDSYDDQSLSAWQSQRRLPPMSSDSSGSGGGGGGDGGGFLGGSPDGSEATRPAVLAPPSRSSRSPSQVHDHDYGSYSAVPSTLGAYLRQPLPKAPPKPTGGSGAGAGRLSNGRRTSEGGGGGGGGGSDSPIAAAQRHQPGGGSGKEGDTGSGSEGSVPAYPTTSLLQSNAAGATASGGSGGAGGAFGTAGASGAVGGGGGGGGGQHLSHIVFGGNWQLGEGWLSQDGAALAAATSGAGASGAGSGSWVYGSQVLTFPNGINGPNGPSGGGMSTRRGHNPTAAGLRNAMSMDLPYDNPYVAPGSLYAEYMDAVMSRHALRQHGGGGAVLGGAGSMGGGGCSSSSFSPSPPLPATGLPGLAVLGAAPPVGPRSPQHAVLTVRVVGGGGNGGRDSTSSSLEKGVSNDSDAGAASGIGHLRRRSRPALLHVTDEALSAPGSAAELPVGRTPQPPEQQHPQLHPALSLGARSEAPEEDREDEEKPLQLEQQDLLGRSFANELQHEQGITLPSVDTTSSDPTDRAAGASRGAVSPSAVSPPSTATTWFSSPPPMPGPPRNTRHTFLYAAAPSTAPSTPTGATGAVPPPPPLRATPSAGICLVEINGIGGGVSGGGGGGGDAGDSTGGGDGSAAVPLSPFGRGRGMGPAPVLVSVNSSPSSVTHISSGVGVGVGGGVGFLPGSGGGSRNPGGGSSGGAGAGADRPHGLAALAAAAAAHLPTINHHVSPLLQESSGHGLGGNSHGGSPSRFHSQHQHPHHLQPSGGSNGGGAIRGSSSVSPTSRVSWGSSPVPGTGSNMGSGGNNGGSSGTGGGILLPHLSLDSRLGSGSSGGGGGGRGSGSSAGNGGRGFEMPSPPPPPPQARRDVIQASRAQVLSMAQALLAQQQGNGSTSSAVNHNSSSSSGRLESLRPLDGGLKRAQCGGSFLAYVQQAPHSASAAAASGGAAGGGSRVLGGGEARALEPVPLTS